MQLEIEILEGKCDPGILLPLWREGLPELDERRIAWAYENNPEGGGLVGLIQDRDEKCYVGCCAIFPRTFYTGGQTVRGGIPGDFAVRKKWRSFGPAQKLQKAMARYGKFDILLAFPNRKAEAVQLRAGYAPLAGWVRFVKPIPDGPHERVPFPAPWKWAVFSIWDLYWRWKWSDVKKKGASGGFVRHGVYEALDELWEGGKGKADFLGARNARYLEWRFGRHPYRPHKIFFLKGEDSARWLGYIIFFVNDRTAYVQDFFLRDPEKDRKNLFAGFQRYGRRRGWRAVSVSLAENRKWMEWFPEMGFSAEETELKVLFHQEKEILPTGADIFLTPGDCDF